MNIPKDLIHIYVQRRHADVQSLLKSILIHSIDEFVRIGHQLSGNAKSFGFEDLEAIALELELVNLQTLQSQGPVLVDKLKNWLVYHGEK